MKLIKNLQDNHTLSIAIKKTYEQVKFNKGFVEFLESLAINNLISSNYNRNKKYDGILWDDQLLNDGIIFETNNDLLMLLHKDYADIVTVTGTKQSIEIFEYLLKLNDVLIESQSL